MISGGRLFCRGRFLALAAGDAAGDRHTGRDHHIEAVAVTVAPDRTDFEPLSLFLVAAFLGLDDDIGGVGWFAAHGLSPSSCLMGRVIAADASPFTPADKERSQCPLPALATAKIASRSAL